MTQPDAQEQQRGGKAGNHAGKGPTYILDIEGIDYPWHEPKITVAQIRDLAGWTTDQQVVIVDLDTNVETVLDENTPIDLKPGHGFGRKFKFRRGSA